ncbi:MAG: S8 family peptidase [Anaerolineae bacterium]
MIEKLVARSRSVNWNKAFSMLLTVVLLVSWMVMAPAPEASPRAQPVLLGLATESPEEIVGVIVQKLVRDTRVENMVARMGGVVTKDLYIINAFAVELPAKAVPELARAAGVRWVSLDAAVVSSGEPVKDADRKLSPPNYYLDTLGVRRVWDMGLQGQGITVVVIDSGISTDQDFSDTDNSFVRESSGSATRLRIQLSFNPNSTIVDDVYGHGTWVAGIIGGNGADSRGAYAGIAPKVNLISLKISDENGMAYESDTVDAMQWVLQNKDKYNIRVVNLSINSTVKQSYHTSPMDAAAEILWFNRIVVVASAGNKGPDGGYNTIDAAPANDPFIITVGASDEHGTADRSDDTVAPFSAYGRTMDGFLKPDIVAPGRDIISVLAVTSSWDVEHPDRVVLDGEYFRLSGTSASAPMVAGAAALLLQDEPDLTPDQVKYRLMHTGSAMTIDCADAKDYLDVYLNVYTAVTGTTSESANTGIEASQLLWTGDDPVNWDSVNWDSVNWDSVNWDSVNWDSVNWDSVNWDSVSFSSVNWD